MEVTAWDLIVLSFLLSLEVIFVAWVWMSYSWILRRGGMASVCEFRAMAKKEMGYDDFASIFWIVLFFILSFGTVLLASAGYIAVSLAYVEIVLVIFCFGVISLKRIRAWPQLKALAIKTVPAYSNEII